MKIYNYDAITKEYKNWSIAEESPLEPGVFLFPANSTIKPPIETNDNEACIFESDNWTIVPDFRGLKYWTIDKEEVEIKDVNVVAPHDSYALYEDIPLTPEEIKEEKAYEAKLYLLNTDWIVTKISELQLEGVDVEPLKVKYAAELAERKLMREVV